MEPLETTHTMENRFSHEKLEIISKTNVGRKSNKTSFFLKTFCYKYLGYSAYVFAHGRAPR